MKSTLHEYRHVLIIGAIMFASAGLLLYLGRNPWCECGTIKLWHGDNFSAENSQHISDWYSFSHVVHGLLSYGLLSLIAGRQSIGRRAIAATLVEEAWEILENTDAMIERYRETTISLGYVGDSVINSVGDVGFMLTGFWLASRLPAKATVGLAVGLELLAGVAIRDNLTLNLIMLIHPLEAIRTWQLGA
ncbi:MAG: DUF2585 family protein [Hyphomicrobiales bacterium]|nr:DUF2585 family protein [Hyphomicrobiales bacterium]